jgi:hypothetical protein
MSADEMALRSLKSLCLFSPRRARLGLLFAKEVNAVAVRRDWGVQSSSKGMMQAKRCGP